MRIVLIGEIRNILSRAGTYSRATCTPALSNFKLSELSATDVLESRHRME